METSGGIQASLAGRYATALFGLARDERQIDAVGSSLDSSVAGARRFARLRGARLEPADRPRRGRQGLRRASRRSSRLDPITANFLGVLANNGRMSQLQTVIRAFRRLAADHRGETTAEVVTAHPLNDDQIAALEAAAARPRRPRRRDRRAVDPEILGGIVVKLGSQMIDASIRTKLNTLAQAMKG